LVKIRIEKGVDTPYCSGEQKEVLSLVFFSENEEKRIKRGKAARRRALCKIRRRRQDPVPKKKRGSRKEKGQRGVGRSHSCQGRFFRQVTSQKKEDGKELHRRVGGLLAAAAVAAISEQIGGVEKVKGGKLCLEGERFTSLGDPVRRVLENLSGERGGLSSPTTPSVGGRPI